MKVKILLTTKAGRVRKYLKMSSRRLSAIWTEAHGKLAYIWVSYGKFKDCFGKMVEFTNDRIYENKHDAVDAYKSFIDR